MDEIVKKADQLMGQNRWKEAEALLVYCREAAARKGDKAAAGTLLGKIQEGKAVWQEAFNEAASGKKVSACSILDKYDLGI